MKKLLISVLVLIVSCAASAEQYSLVINNGRVMDPESGLDALRHVGIIQGQVAAISKTPLAGDEIIDARGRAVAPGFIDLHTHSPTELGQYYQLFDGVTTALELEAGMHPVLDYGKEVSQAPLINYGASAGYLGARLLVMNGLAMASPGGIPRPQGLQGWWTATKLVFQDFNTALSATFTKPASETERQQLRVLLEEDLDNGALGIGLALDYVSEAVDAAELRMIFAVAGERSAPVFVHIRRGVNGDPGGLREVLAMAGEYSAPVHICHITHNAMRNIDLFLAEVRAAQMRGVDVTVGVLPYNAGSTFISAAVFDRDWQTIFGITYEDVEWAATGERFNEAMWRDYRARYPQGAVIHHYLKDEWTRRALAEPGSIVVSDLIPMKTREEKVPPHNAAFSRVLGHYVREENVLDLMTALAKMTLLPARRLESYAPALARKGRVQPGMDADLVIFDPATVIDKATYQQPYQESEGFSHVIVNGVVVVRNGELVENVTPGQRIVAAK